MKIFVVGGGGREHAIIWKLKQDKRACELHCAPGNGGIEKIAKCVDIKSTDIENLLQYAIKEKFDLVIVAPDDPLAMGLVDMLQERDIRAFGPVKAAAMIEASKVFAKQLMKKYNIPTAEYEVFEDYRKAFEHLKSAKYPLVVKADGLALGKGVIICETPDKAAEALKEIMVDRIFKSAGERVVIEEFLSGPEVSVIAFCDGKTIKPMVSAQDHKKAYDNDRGPNTGGMGAFAPALKYTPEICKITQEKIICPTVKAMESEGRRFKGVLYFGLMLTDEGPKVLEYNARFGDPETQAVLPLLKTSLIDIIDAVIDEKLDKIDIKWSDKTCVCVVAASGGYPGSYEKGKLITGLNDVDKDITVFHAGTRFDGGAYYTNGGRVLGVTATGGDIEEARQKAYSNLEKIHFDGMHYRRDIGIKK